MARGVIYVMTTVVPGLAKIGKTQTDQFERRMYQLEHNGYYNVVGLQREFAIEVENYDEKEDLIDDIFSKSRVHVSELFSLDVDLVVQLLSSFEGKQIYPEIESKEEAFSKAAAERREHADASLVPDGTYYMERKLKRDGNRLLKVQMVVEEGNFIIKSGQRVSTTEGAGLTQSVRKIRAASIDEKGTVIDDVSFDFPSTAGSFAIGAACDGWREWKTKGGQAIEIYRR